MNSPHSPLLAPLYSIPLFSKVRAVSLYYNVFCGYLLLVNPPAVPANAYLLHGKIPGKQLSYLFRVGLLPQRRLYPQAPPPPPTHNRLVETIAETFSLVLRGKRQARDAEPRFYTHACTHHLPAVLFCYQQTETSARYPGEKSPPNTNCQTFFFKR